MVGLILLFFTLSPALILYTAGYRYDWALHRLEQTGVLSVDIEPGDATVFVNGIRITKPMPLRLANRVPGTYELRIEKPGYKSWHKDVTIESKQSTYIKNISLFKEALPALILPDTDRKMLAMSASESGAAIAVTYLVETFYEIDFFHAKTGEMKTIGRYAAAVPPEVLWSPFHEMAIIRLRDASGWKMQFLDGVTGDTFRTYTFPSRDETDGVQWAEDTLVPTLYVQEKNILRKITANDIVQIATIPHQSVWHIQSDETVWIGDPDAKTLSPAAHPENAISYATDSELKSIIHMNNRRVILRTNRGMVIQRLDPAEEQEIGAVSIRYHGPTKEWIAWSPWELWAIYEDGRAALLNRTSEETAIISPMDAYGVLLLASAESLIAFNPGYYVSHELFRGGDIEAAAVEPQTKRIYFVGTVASRRGLFALEF